ncbi:MAG: hypothetical protein QM733_06405 [Ilumatobacteraceae bacterium]
MATWVYLALAGAVLCYAASSLLLSQGADHVRGRHYLAGLGAQGVAFVLAFAARHSAPLLIVQAAVTTSVAVTAVVGARLGRWRLTAGDGVALAAVVGAIALLGACAESGPATPLTGGPLLICTVVTLGALTGAAMPLPRSARGATLGALAGIGFGGSAIAARALSGDPAAMLHALRSLDGLLAAGLIVAGLLVGQLMLTLAFRSADPAHRAPGTGSSGSVTGPVSAMYLLSTVWPTVAGLAWLGDKVKPGRGGLAVVGLAVALGGSMALARHE